MHPWCRCHFNPVVDDWDKWLDDYEQRHGENNNLDIPRGHSKLSDDEKYAINQYISSAAYKLNEKLRRNLPLTSEEEKIRIDLDSALAKMSSYEGNLTRSLLFNSDEELNSFLDTHQIGSIVEYREYISATYGDVYNPDAQIQIYVLNSRNGKDISAINPQEREVLYQRNSLFKVTEVKKVNNKFHIILEELNNFE